MSVTGATTRNDYVASSGQTVFQYTFQTLAASDITVIVNGITKSLGSDYSVSNVGVAGGGYITLNEGASTGYVVSIYLSMPIDRTTQYQNAGDFLASDVNNDMDKAYVALNQVQTDISRAIRLEDQDPSVDLKLPLKVNRSNKYLAFGGDGNVVAIDGPTPSTIYQGNNPIPGHHSFSVLNAPQASLERFNLTKQGPGANNVVQGFAQDPYTNELFTMYITGDPDNLVVNQFEADGKRSQTAQRWTPTASPTLGHQELDISWDKSGQRWFWTGENERVSNQARFIKRFQVSNGSGTDLVISNEQTYQVWTDAETTGNENGSSTTCISLDGRYLVTEYSDTTTDTQTIKIFNAHDLMDGGGGTTEPADYSTTQVFKWTFSLDNSVYPLQSMACDGAYVYVFTGNIASGPSLKVLVFTMSGTLVQEFDDFVIGEAKALADPGANYEMEGAGWIYHGGQPFLSVSIASGDPGARKNRIWAMGAGLAVTAYGDGNRPAFISQGGNDFAVPDGQVMKLGHYNGFTDTFTESLSISADNELSFAAATGAGTGNQPTFISRGVNDYAVPDGEVMRIGHYNSSTDTFTENLNISTSGVLQAHNDMEFLNSSDVVKGTIGITGDEMFIANGSNGLRMSGAGVNNIIPVDSSGVATDGVTDLGASIHAFKDFFVDNKIKVKDATIGTTLSGGVNEIYIADTVCGLRMSGAGDNNIIPVDSSGVATDGVTDLGSSVDRFDTVFATTGTINTSDANQKQQIEELSEAELRVALSCKGLLRKFKLNSAVDIKGDDARIHVGIIAQDLKAAFEAEGLNAGEYGMFTESTGIDGLGVERTALGVRYSELLAFIIAAI